MSTKDITVYSSCSAQIRRNTETVGHTYILEILVHTIDIELIHLPQTVTKSNKTKTNWSAETGAQLADRRLQIAVT